MHILARVVQDWKQEGCHLRPGGMVEGHVVKVIRCSKTEKTSVLQLSFDKADCNDHPSTEYKFTLIALIGPYGDPPPDGMIEGPPLADAPGLSFGNDIASTGPLAHNECGDPSGVDVIGDSYPAPCVADRVDSGRR